MDKDQAGLLHTINFKDEGDGTNSETMVVYSPDETRLIKMLMTNLQTTIAVASAVDLAKNYAAGGALLYAEKKEIIDDEGLIYHIKAGGDEDSEEIFVFAKTQASMIRFLVKHLQIELSKATAFDVWAAYERGDGVLRIDDDGKLVK